MLANWTPGRKRERWRERERERERGGCERALSGEEKVRWMRSCGEVDKERRGGEKLKERKSERDEKRRWL